MTLERRDPIPPGVYWVDVVRNDARPGFERWLKDNAATVKVRNRADKGQQSAMARHLGLRSTFGLWVLFEALEPTKRWPLSVKVGLPTIAQVGRKTKQSDVVQRAPAQGVREYWGAQMGDILTTPGGMLGALFVAWMLSRR